MPGPKSTSRTAEQPLAFRLAMQLSENTGYDPSPLYGPSGEVVRKPTPVRNASAKYIGRDANNLPIYQVTYYDHRGQRVIKTTAWSSTKNSIMAPNIRTNRTKSIAQPGGSRPRPGQSVDAQTGNSEILALRSAQQWVLGGVAKHFKKFSAADLAHIKNYVNNFTGSAAELMHYGQRIINDVIHAPTQIESTTYDPNAGPQHDTTGGDGGSGGLGGFTGPEYRAPDRRVVEDFTRGVQVSLVGSVNESETKRLTDLYMKDHRRNFDSASQEIDPSQSVTEAVRNTEKYKTIHKLRPDGADERTWIAERRALGERGGLAEGELDQFATDQATVGGSGEDVTQAGAVRQFQNTGQAPEFLDVQFRQAARGMLAAVR